MLVFWKKYAYVVNGRSLSLESKYQSTTEILLAFFEKYFIRKPFPSEATTGGVLLKRYFYKFCKILRKYCVRVSVWTNLQVPGDSGTGIFCEFFEAFKNTYFTEHLRATASASSTFVKT